MTGSTVPRPRPTRVPGPQDKPRLDAAKALTEQEARKKRRDRIRNFIGIAILGGAFLWAAGHVTWLALTTGDTGILGVGEENTVRFAHWQLEGGIVSALNDAGRLYEKFQKEQFGRDVRVQQIEVPERAYEQWVRTQLIGRTAPDLIEMRSTGWDSLIVRYFVPISDRIDEPNPYNAADLDARLGEMLGQGKGEAPADMGRVAWRETYIDDMKGGWYNNLQDYYGMPLSVFTIRAFANRDILEKAVAWAWEDEKARRAAEPGSEPMPTAEAFAAPYFPPQDLGAFFTLCQYIEGYSKANKLKLVPIAGSNYTEAMFRNKYWDMATYGLVGMADRNFDGLLQDSERLEAVFTDRVNFLTNPRIEAGHRVLFDICRHFQPGFMAANRDQSVFLFAQGFAAMIATGTWDAGSLYEQVGDDFNIMVFDYPVPKPDQKYGDLIRHRVSEAGVQAGFPFGLTKFSRNRDLAIDFMRFLTSRQVNEWLNKRFRWFPANQWAETDPLLEAFRPKLEGVPGGIWKMYVGGDTQRLYESMYQAYIGAVQPPGVADYEAFARKQYEAFIRDYNAVYHKEALEDYLRKWQDAYAPIVQTELSLAEVRSRILRGGMTDEARRNYVSLIVGQARRVENRAVDWRLLQDARATTRPEGKP